MTTTAPTAPALDDQPIEQVAVNTIRTCAWTPFRPRTPATRALRWRWPGYLQLVGDLDVVTVVEETVELSREGLDLDLERRTWGDRSGLISALRRRGSVSNEAIRCSETPTGRCLVRSPTRRSASWVDADSS